MAILITGGAGFIGAATAERLIRRGDEVVLVDNLNSYYSVALKQARLDHLRSLDAGLRFLDHDFSDYDGLAMALEGTGIEKIVHLGAQPGVRYSIEHPFAYAASNLTGHLALLELARARAVEHMVYASSSSVYGNSAKAPFSVEDRSDHPISLYAATKRADELFAHAYAHLFGLPQTGLRFFTVYGPWGRPDMAYYSFAEAILSGRPITVYDGGKVRRDFTFIEDAVQAVLALAALPPAGPPRVVNIGNHRSEPVSALIALLEAELGRRAVIVDTPRPAADVAETCADVERLRGLVGFSPETPLDRGIARFAAWFREWHMAGGGSGDARRDGGG